MWGAHGRNQHFSDCEEERGLGVGTGRKPVVDFSNLYPLKKKKISVDVGERLGTSLVFFFMLPCG